ncbi:MAG: DinB family protein [Puia sp.]|nr:DinB family protein [Puia sp.]
MRKEIDTLLAALRDTLNGAPWYGKSVYAILAECDPAKASIRPSAGSHTLLELLYHMLSWAEFTRLQLENGPGFDPAEYEKTMDWPVPDKKEDTWEQGLRLFKDTHEKILELLSVKEDVFLSEQARERKYDFRFLLNGLIQHNIYHQGQIAFLHKLLAG